MDGFARSAHAAAGSKQEHGTDSNRMMKTYVPKAGDVKHAWFVVDADGVPLGRLAARIATLLKGKHKAEYTPHLDLGDHVVVVNCERVKLTGRKLEQKNYYHHTGYPGGLRQRPVADLMAKKPEDVVRLAVRGMLPRNRLGRAIMKKLKIYRGADHRHTAQGPEPLPEILRRG
jgi:large subunit ribosomal protein L13